MTSGIMAANVTANAQQTVTPMGQAFKDAMSILSKDNSCRRFYGETKTTEELLRRLANQFQIRLLKDSRTAVEMSGNFIYFDETETHVGYRLFTIATINTGGPFLKSKVFSAEPYVPPVGSFRPNTRQARVLILLHELAHLVKGRDGNWLIPDDGNAALLSKQNTTVIESECKAQILSL
jgi:hypothetical protein